MDFDQYSDRYDALLASQQGLFARDRRFFHRAKVSQLRGALRIAPARVLDFGCGVGGALLELREAFPGAELFGHDPSGESLRKAGEACPWATMLDVEALRSERFDLIFISCVLHHVPPDERRQAITDVAGRLTPGGAIAVFEHNPWNPVTRLLVRRCPFDADAVLLTRRESEALVREAGLADVRRGYFLVFPEWLRLLQPLERMLRALPIGGQYFVIGTNRGDRGDPIL
jgi:SAM-dependent methyltransferase